MSEHETVHAPERHSCRPSGRGDMAGTVKRCLHCGAWWQASDFGFYHRMDFIDRLAFGFRLWKASRQVQDGDYVPPRNVGKERP